MNWLYYLAESNLYLLVFYLTYFLFFKNTTHYQLNRAYLLFCCIASFILPILQISALKPIKPAPILSPTKQEALIMTVNAYATEPINVRLPNPPIQSLKTLSSTAPEMHKSAINLPDLLWYVYLVGAFITLSILIIKLITIYKFVRNGQISVMDKHRVIEMKDSDAAFSFFNNLFIGTKIKETNTIIKHELIHIHQKHSADIIFLELVKIFNWFNPTVYLVQNSLKIVHEYIADEQIVSNESEAIAYSTFLLQTAFGSNNSSITNSFFNYSQLKNRIMMLNKQRSSKLVKFKYLIIAPIFLILISVSTLSISKNYGWIDIFPIHLNSVDNNGFKNPISAVKSKRLKITQNGKSTITDRLTISEQNKKVTYTASSITPGDKIALLKNNKITVDFMDDSTKYSTKDGKLILPIVNSDGYYLLDYYLHHNVHYSSNKGEKGGLVIVGYSLDQNRHLINVKITKSGGTKLDELALNGFNNYKGIVNDDSGKNYNLGVYFFTNDYSIFKTDSMDKIPGFAGEVIIPNFKYPYEVTKKGFEYVERGVGFPGDDSREEVIIFEKNGAAVSFFKAKLTNADLKMLNDKYGYVFPSASSNILTFMNKKDKHYKRLAYFFDMNSYLDKPYSDDFYNHIIDTMEYPKTPQIGIKGAVVIVNFNLDTNGIINDVNVDKSAGIEYDNAAIKAIQSYKKPIKDKAGRHSIAIVFCVANKKYRPTVSDKIKKTGYVGELAVAESKPFFRPSMMIKVDSVKK